MQVVKIIKYNDDGSVMFEGNFGPNEVKYILDVGTNFLLTQGAFFTEEEKAALESGELDEDEPELFEVPDDGSPTLQ